MPSSVTDPAPGPGAGACEAARARSRIDAAFRLLMQVRTLMAAITLLVLAVRG